MTPTPRSSVVCRPIGLEEIDSLLALETACFETDRITRRNCRRLLRSPSALCMGAFQRGKLVGAMVLLFRRNAKSARIYSLAVDPAARGLGAGRRLVEVAEQAARRRGCVRMRLEVRMDILPAIRLYESRGYVESGVIPAFYEDRASAFVFRKELA